MAQAFAGTLLLPGEEGPGLDAVLETTESDVKLVTGERELGSWSTEECSITPSGEGAFTVVLGGETVQFYPDTPNQFAERMAPSEPVVTSTPLKARIDAQTGGKRKSQSKPAKIEPLKSVAKEDVLGRTMTVMIVAISCVLMFGLLLLSSNL